MMEPHATQSNKVVSKIPMEGVKHTKNAESTISDETNEEVREITTRISLLGTSVGCLKKKLLALDINGLVADIGSPPPKDQKADTIIARRASEK